MIGIDLLREVLTYDPDTGVFTWKISTSNRAPVGSIAGTGSVQGYCRVRVLGHLYWAHRLAWFHVYGEWPPAGIDHINGDRAGNRLLNLRPATDAENMQNVGMKSNSRTGVRGAAKRGERWIAQIGVGGQGYYLGVHPTAEAAHAAYLTAKQRLHTFNPTLRKA